MKKFCTDGNGNLYRGSRCRIPHFVLLAPGGRLYDDRTLFYEISGVLYVFQEEDGRRFLERVTNVWIDLTKNGTVIERYVHRLLTPASLVAAYEGRGKKTNKISDEEIEMNIQKSLKALGEDLPDSIEDPQVTEIPTVRPDSDDVEYVTVDSEFDYTSEPTTTEREADYDEFVTESHSEDYFEPSTARTVDYDETATTSQPVEFLSGIFIDSDDSVTTHPYTSERPELS